MHRRERFTRASNYAVFYGRESPDELTNYDVVIVEPQAHDECSLTGLKSRNTLVIGYVSVMEASSHHPDFHVLSDLDFLKFEGQALKNHTFDTWLLNLASKRWQSLLHHQIGYLIRVLGYDGVFLDTIGDVEFPHFTGTTRVSLMEAALDLVRSVREIFPEAVLIQNNGLEMLLDKTATYLDGVCWENPPCNIVDPWVKNILMKLGRYSEGGLRTLLLSDKLDEPTDRLTELQKRIPGSLTYRSGADYVSFVTEQN